MKGEGGFRSSQGCSLIDALSSPFFVAGLILLGTVNEQGLFTTTRKLCI
jgi:hypothetical protein